MHAALSQNALPGDDPRSLPMLNLVAIEYLLSQHEISNLCHDKEPKMGSSPFFFLLCTSKFHTCLTSLYHCLYTICMDYIKSGKILTLLRTSPKLSFITNLIIYIIKTRYSIQNIKNKINRPQFGLFHNKTLRLVSSPNVPPILDKYFSTTG